MSHCVGRYNPSTLTQFGRDIKLLQQRDVGEICSFEYSLYTYLIIQLLLLETECDEGNTFTAFLAQDGKFASVFQFLGQVVSSLDKVLHDVSESNFTKSNQDIVLCNDVGSSFTKVEGERCLRFTCVSRIMSNVYCYQTYLVRTEIVDVENQILRQVLFASPQGPADTRVSETILVTRDINRMNSLKLEIPTCLSCY